MSTFETQAGLFDVALAQDQGRVRERQEDSVLAQLLCDGQVALLAVADGMGGHQAGDAASAAAVGAVAATLLPEINSLRPVETLRLPAAPEGEETLDEPSPLATAQSPQPTATLADLPDMKETLRQAVGSAHEAVRRVAEELDALGDAGSTLTVACIIGQNLYLAHVGDSRAYLWRRSQLRQMTMDHSGAAALVAAGVIAPEEARDHPAVHQLYRYLGGASNTARPDILEERLEPGDLLMLCSDGLWGMLTDEAIVGSILAGYELQELAQTLTAAANEAGGEDNITVVLARLAEQTI